MRSGFLPRTDAGLLAWSTNFSTRISATPTAFGLTAALASAFATATANYTTALAACEPGVRNKAAVAAKKSAAATLKQQAGLLSKLVEGTASVTDAQKEELGLNVKAPPSPIPAPSTSPAIDIISVTGRTVRIRLHDAANPKKRKPVGVKGVTVFSHVGPTVPSDVNAWKFEGNTNESIADITFPATVTPGTVVWVNAFWFNNRSESGPIGSGVSTMIGFGVSAMAA